MKLVTLAQITLNRVGTASNVAFANDRRISRLVEVLDGDPQTVSEAIQQVAVEQGDGRESLKDLRQVDCWNP